MFFDRGRLRERISMELGVAMDRQQIKAGFPAGLVMASDGLLLKDVVVPGSTVMVEDSSSTVVPEACAPPPPPPRQREAEVPMSPRNPPPPPPMAAPTLEPPRDEPAPYEPWCLCFRAR